MSDFNDKFNDFNNTADTTYAYDANDIAENKIMAIFSYISWLVLVPIFGAKESKFARFHANQGLALAIAEVVVIVILSILGKIPVIGWIFRLVDSLFGIVCLLFSVIGIINAANGRAKELPIVGRVRILK